MKEAIEKLINAKRRKRELEKTLKEIIADISLFEQTVIASMEQIGMTNLKTDTGETIYINRKLRASVRPTTDMTTLREMLDLAGYTDVIKETVNFMTLQGLVKELDDKEELNDNWRELLNIYEQINLGIRGLK